MKKRFNKLASVLICITFAVFLLFLKDKVDVIWGVICNLATVLTPIIYAFAIAYILNFPYRFLSNKVFGKIKAKRFQRFIKPVSLATTYIAVLGLISFMFATLIPQLTENVALLAKSFPQYSKTFSENMKLLMDWISAHGIDVTSLENLNSFIGDFLSKLFSPEILTNISSVVINTGIVFYNWIIGLILSVYMLASKDFLLNQVKRFATAFLPTPWMPTIFEIIDVTDDKCGKFMVGKILDSTIMGIMCFITMTVIGLPYALLISVIVSVCNIIPFFGPFIGGIPSAALLLMISPIDCIIFVIMIFILQQIDGNFIGPRIVGSKVGLVGFWSLFSVLVAGGLFGVAGMILGTPIFAAIYTLIGKKVKSRIAMKGENAQKVLATDVLNSTSLTNIKASNLKIKKHSKDTHTSKENVDEEKDNKE
ncbi:MAG: AI-2E family transporter [Ruminococcus sp.]